MDHFYPILLAAYLLLTIYTIGVILLNTETTSKALGYLLLVLLLPAIGLAIYYSFGLNLRHLSSKSKGFLEGERLDREITKQILSGKNENEGDNREISENFNSLIHFLKQIGNEPFCESYFSLLTNGEEKFPEVLRILETAKHFIHMEYYAWENDVRGNQIKDVLLRKAKAGVQVRVLFDDYASRKIKPNIVKELKAGGVSIFPRIKVRFVALANRINHRDHRKVIIVDGSTGFVGGINVSDRYDNSIDTGLYWRDTHVKIEGPLVNSLQRHFLVAWNSVQPDKLHYSHELFPSLPLESPEGLKAMGQVVAGGPIYPRSNIMLSYFKIFTLAKERIYITNPYFIPNETILNALKQAAISGVDVRIIMPFQSDSAIVGAAAKFYYPELVQAGVKIYLYKKGFIHAKTVVADGYLSVIGTANMDVRSFDLNFEIMSVIYGSGFGSQFEKVFMKDLEECLEVTSETLRKTSIGKRLAYAVARLISSFL